MDKKLVEIAALWTGGLISVTLHHIETSTSR
jgi:hypothetical protein